MEVIVQSTGFSQKFRRKQNAVRAVFFPHGSSIAHGNGGLDDDHGSWGNFADQLEYRLHIGGIEKVLLIVIVGWGCHDHIIRIPVGGLRVGGGPEVQRRLPQILFDLRIPDGGLLPVQHFYLAGNHIHGPHLMVLRQQHGKGQAHIADSGNRNLHSCSSTRFLSSEECSTYRSFLYTPNTKFPAVCTALRNPDSPWTWRNSL